LTPSETMIRNLLAAHWPGIADATFENAEKYRENGPGCDIVGYPIPEGPGVTEEPEKAAEEKAADNLFLSAADLAGGDFPPPEYLWDKFVLKDHVNLLYGDGKAGKTSLALHIAVATAAGVDLFGHAVKGPLPVLMVLAEDAAGAVKRSANDICANLGVSLADLPITFCCKPPVDLTLAVVEDRGGWQAGPFYTTLAGAIEKLGPGVVFLDTAVDFAVLNENLRAPVTTFCRKVLGGLADRYKATIVLNAHPSAKLG
jgi:hypothetical protein